MLLRVFDRQLHGDGADGGRDSSELLAGQRWLSRNMSMNHSIGSDAVRRETAGQHCKKDSERVQSLRESIDGSIDGLLGAMERCRPEMKLRRLGACRSAGGAMRCEAGEPDWPVTEGDHIGRACVLVTKNRVREAGRVRRQRNATRKNRSNLHGIGPIRPIERFAPAYSTIQAACTRARATAPRSQRPLGGKVITKLIFVRPTRSLSTVGVPRRRNGPV